MSLLHDVCVCSGVFRNPATGERKCRYHLARPHERGPGAFPAYCDILWDMKIRLDLFRGQQTGGGYAGYVLCWIRLCMCISIAVCIYGWICVFTNIIINGKCFMKNMSVYVITE